MTQRIRTEPTYSSDRQLNKIIEEEAEKGFEFDRMEVLDRNYVLYFNEETEQRDGVAFDTVEVTNGDNLETTGRSNVVNTPDEDPRQEDMEEYFSREILKAFGFDQKAIDEIIEEEFEELE